MDTNVQAKPRMPPIENFADTGPVGVLNPCCTIACGPIRALTGRRRTRPTSTGCRKPWQPEPGRAPLILAQAAVQTNRATSPPLSIDRGFGFIRTWAATDAAAYEGKLLREGLLDKSNTAGSVWADTAYRSKANETFMAENGFTSRLQR